MSEISFIDGLPSSWQLLCKKPAIMAIYTTLAKEAELSSGDISLISPTPPLLSEWRMEPSSLLLEGCTVAAYVADILCYSAPSDQVDLPRLSEIMQVFPMGFTIAYTAVRTQADKHVILPVGYTGWFPIKSEVYQEMTAGNLSDRRVLRPCLDPAQAGGIYLFNSSVIESCQSKNLPPGSPKISKPMLLKRAEDITRFCAANPKIQGLASITVSGDGSRNLEKHYQMTQTGTVQDGSGEKIWISKL